MKLNKFYLRYYPPGIILEHQKQGKTRQKVLDLFEIEQETDIEALATRIASNEPLITPKILPQLVILLQKLKSLTNGLDGAQFLVHKTLSGGHLLPITNMCIDKHGSVCATASYDRTCKIWDTQTGKESLTLIGHENAVYNVSLAMAERVLTGSFDKTARIWSLDDSGECLCVMRGHSGEIVAIDINGLKQTVATSSMDKSTRLFSTATGQNVATLIGHTGEVIANQFNSDGSILITGSFDSTIKLWDTRSARYDFACKMIASGSLDGTAKLWDIRRTDNCCETIAGHTDEVLDVCFDLIGHRLATASSDCSACVWDTYSGDLISAMIGHTEEVSKVFWEPAGHHLLTSSQDQSSMLWNVNTGQCSQELKGHSDHVFSAEMSYLGDTILTASKDNTCIVWQKSNKKNHYDKLNI